jgi:hypothetical protein
MGFENFISRKRSGPGTATPVAADTQTAAPARAATTSTPTFRDHLNRLLPSMPSRNANRRPTMPARSSDPHAILALRNLRVSVDIKDGAGLAELRSQASFPLDIPPMEGVASAPSLQELHAAQEEEIAAMLAQCSKPLEYGVDELPSAPSWTDEPPPVDLKLPPPPGIDDPHLASLLVPSEPDLPPIEVRPSAPPEEKPRSTVPHPDQNYREMLTIKSSKPWEVELGPVVRASAPDLVDSDGFPVDEPPRYTRFATGDAEEPSPPAEPLAAAAAPAETQARPAASRNTLFRGVASQVRQVLQGPAEGSAVRSAVRSRDHTRLQQLLDAGLDPMAPSHGGRTAMQHARRLGDTVAIDMLQAAIDRRTSAQQDGQLPLSPG